MIPMNTEQIHVFDYTISPTNFMQLLSKTGQLINFFYLILHP